MVVGLEMEIVVVGLEVEVFVVLMMRVVGFEGEGRGRGC